MRKILSALCATTALFATDAAADAIWNNKFPVGFQDPANRIQFVMAYKGKNYYSESSYFPVTGQFFIFDIIDFTVVDYRTENAAPLMNVRFHMADCVNQDHFAIAFGSGRNGFEVMDNIRETSHQNAFPIGGPTPQGVRAAEVCLGELLTPIPIARPQPDSPGS
jgi:hypothetical protein